MKQLFSLMLISLTLFSCSKSNEDEDEGGGGMGGGDQTTTNFTNTLDVTFNNVKIGSWQGGGQAKLIRTVGSFAPGARTGEIVIADRTITRVYFYYDLGADTYMTPLGFSISQGTFNNWQINGNTKFDKISKTDIYYPQ